MVFINDFSVYGDSFDKYLDNLTLVIKCFMKTNLVFK